jgi:hypothetical protein
MNWVYSVNNAAYFSSQKKAEEYLSSRVKSLEPIKESPLPFGGTRYHFDNGQHLDKRPVNVA